MIEIYERNKVTLEPSLLAAWLLLLPLYYFTDWIEILIAFILLLVFRLEFFWNVFVKTVENFFGSLDVFFRLFFVLFLSIPGIGIIAWQIYTYLKGGEWVGVSIITCLKYINSSWAIYPRDWEGLWNILNMAPMSLLLLVIAVTILVSDE